jgi:hypothetical protein
MVENGAFDPKLTYRSILCGEGLYRVETAGRPNPTIDLVAAVYRGQNIALQRRYGE